MIDQRQDFQLTKDFRAHEFLCPCDTCIQNGVIGKMDMGFMEKLQAVRDGMDISLIISSGFRCLAHNAALGGKDDSEHTMGHAADILVADSYERLALVDIALREGMNGIGIAQNYVHLDDRPTQRRMWTYYK